MKKAYRYIALALALCTILGAAGFVSATEPIEGTLEASYEIWKMDGVQLREAFFADTRGFLKVLAFQTADQQGDMNWRIWLQTPARTQRVAKDLLQRLNQNKDALQLTQSECNALAAMIYYLEFYNPFSEVPQIGQIDALLQQAVELGESNVDYYKMLLGAALTKECYNFIIELEKLNAQQQEKIIFLIAALNGTVAGVKARQSLLAVEYLTPGYEGSIPPSGLAPFTQEQGALVYVLQDVLSDNAPYAAFQEPVEEELEQWKEKQTLPRTNFAVLMADPDSVDWTAVLRGALLENATFVKALANMEPEARTAFIAAFVEQIQSKKDLEALLYNLSQYTKVMDSAQYRAAAIAELEYAILRRYAGEPWMQTDFSYYIGTEENPSVFIFNDDTFWFCLDACVDPAGFVRMLSTLPAATQEMLSYKIKHAGLETYRQAVVDNVYDLQSKVNLSYKEQVALERLLEYQSRIPSAIYPYGQAPEQPDTTPVVTGPLPTEPTRPLFFTDPGTTPTDKPTDPVNPTDEDTDPSEEEDKKPGDTGWISTVCIILGLLCISIVVTTSLAKKKKEKPKQPDPEDPKPAIEPQPVIPQPVAADPNVRCPAPLDRNVQQQITQALREKYDEYSVSWYSDQNKNGTCRCYGTEEDCHIIFYAGGLRMEISDSCTVGECIFRFGTSFELYAYKDGTLTDLNAALEQGLISAQAVENAWKLHEMTS